MAYVSHFWPRAIETQGVLRVVRLRVLQIISAIPNIHAVIDRAVAASTTQEEESFAQQQEGGGSSAPAADMLADLVVIDST
jgi:hypothetical protein